MPLPQLSTPVYKHFLTGLGKDVEFRAFTVKEQKILLLAKAEDSKESMHSAVTQILSLCTFGKLDIESLAIFDVVDLLIRIRARSVDNMAKHTYKYKYKDAEGQEKDERVVINLNLDDVKIVVDKDHNKVIMLDSSIGVKMRYPTLKDIDVNSKFDDFEQIAKNIEVIFQDDDVWNTGEIPESEVLEFVDNMSASNLKEIQKFYKTMPKIEHFIDVKLKDGTTERIKYETLEDFFT